MDNRKRIILKLIFALIGIMVVLTFFSNTIHNLNIAGVVVGLETSGDITSTHRGRGTLGYPEAVYTHWAEYTGHIALLVADGDSVREDEPLFHINIDRGVIFDRIVHLRNRNMQLPWAQRVETNAEIARLERLLQEDEATYTQYAIADGVVHLSPDMEDRALISEGQPVLSLAARQGAHFEFTIYFPATFIPSPRGAVRRELEINVPALSLTELRGEIDTITAVDGQFRVEFTVIVPGATGGERVYVTIEDRYTTGANHLPNVAIREDTRGDFILVARQVPNTLLGYSYFAERVDIEVTMRGDLNTVFTMRDELDAPVILQSDRPIEAGDRIRLVGEQ